MDFLLIDKYHDSVFHFCIQYTEDLEDINDTILELLSDGASDSDLIFVSEEMFESSRFSMSRQTYADVFN